MLGSRLRGFSRTETIAIVLAFVLDMAWMIWLVVVAWRIQASKAPSPAGSRHESLDALPTVTARSRAADCATGWHYAQ